MERPSFSFLVVSVLLVLPLALSAQDNARRKLIQDRLLSDISTINDQLSRLNRTVNRLEDQISKLKTVNQRQRTRIDELEDTVEELRNRSSSSRTEENVDDADRARRDETASTNNSSAQSSASMWEPRSDVPYQIRREPLNYQLIYVTTDDTTLTKLAHRYYRDAGLWQELYRVNKDKLPSPDVVPPGVRLRLPPINELQSR